ncbi:MAG: secretin N-terminal domain-containing protein [Planctomycetota bacterium]
MKELTRYFFLPMLAVVFALPAASVDAQEQPVLAMFELRHREAGELADMVVSILDKDELSVQVDERGNRLIVAAKREVMARVRETIDLLDVIPESSRPPETMIRTYQLENADAAQVLEVIGRLIVFDENTPVRLSADYRTNNIIVSGTPPELEFIGTLIQRLDEESESAPLVEQPAARTYMVRVTWLTDGDELADEANDLRAPEQRLVPLANALRTSGTLKEAVAVTDMQTAVSVSADTMVQNSFMNASSRVASGYEVTLSASGQVNRLLDGQIHLDIELQMSTGQANTLINTAVSMPVDHPVALSVSDVGYFKSVAVVEIVDMP